jgi:hypothetical protein
MVLEETISQLEVTVAGLNLQLRAGSEQLESARKMFSKLCVISFFDNLSCGRTAEAFQRVSDDVKWWAPGGKLIIVNKERMIKRMELATKTVFTIREIILGESCVAVKVSSATGCFQFMFLFRGEQIVGVNENSDAKPLGDLLKQQIGMKQTSL